MNDACNRLDDLMSHLPPKRDSLALAGYFCHQVLPAMRELRNAADHCEILVGKEYWPLPNYSEMLFYV